ncbi:hypothetical protein [uncultured Dokdonia sp.]|uniref:hypothetical protein n=1 Tax=uncultured Dokdonia sp. TaxID=575653 RepID=UPI0030ECBEAA
MKLKNEPTEVLQTKLNSTKKIMQVLSTLTIIAAVFFVYNWIMNDDGIDSSFSLITIAMVLGIIIFDRKYKNIKAELQTRE